MSELRIYLPGEALDGMEYVSEILRMVRPKL